MAVKKKEVGRALCCSLVVFSLEVCVSISSSYLCMFIETVDRVWQLHP